MAYGVFKILHLVGIIMLIGNVSVTASWKWFADRTGDARIIAHAQSLVTKTEWMFTFWGIVLTGIGGYGAGWVAGLDPFASPWIVQGEILFVVSGVIWVVVLLPLQIRMARAAKLFADQTTVPLSYMRDSRTWFVWGLIATIPLVAAIYVMVFKP